MPFSGRFRATCALAHQGDAYLSSAHRGILLLPSPNSTHTHDLPRSQKLPSTRALRNSRCIEEPTFWQRSHDHGQTVRTTTVDAFVRGRGITQLPCIKVRASCGGPGPGWCPFFILPELFQHWGQWPSAHGNLTMRLQGQTVKKIDIGARGITEPRHHPAAACSCRPA